MTDSSLTGILFRQKDHACAPSTNVKKAWTSGKHITKYKKKKKK
jgi:hypothetical protein